MTTKKFFATIEKDTVTSLKPGQFTVRLTGPGEIVDYAGDIVVPGGITSRSGTVIMLRDHQASQPIGTMAWRLTGSGASASVMGTGTIALGTTPIADETDRLIRASVLTDFSIGFDPITKERIPTGYKFTSWRLMECSAVSVGCLPTAVILQKSAKGNTMPKPTEFNIYNHLTREERKARAAEIIGRDISGRPGPAVPGLNPAYHDHIQRSVAHCNAVHQLQRQTSPSRNDRLVKAEQFAKKIRPAGY